MNETSAGYRMRFRFRVGKFLNIDGNEAEVRFDARSVTLSAEFPDKLISQSEWLIVDARGFATEEEARRFGHDFRAACVVASAVNGLGIDGGTDLSSFSLGISVQEHMRKSEGIITRRGVHGVDVFLDDPAILIFSAQFAGIVSENPQHYLDDVSDLLGCASTLSQRGQEIVLLLNYALMRSDPVAQIVFSISAVEMLGQKESWSAAQKTQFRELVSVVKASTTCSRLESDEIVFALENCMHKNSLRKGVMRLLDSLGLRDLKRDWDSLYEERSTLVHGLAPQPGVKYEPLASRAINLCGRILMTAVAKELPGAGRRIDSVYPRGT